MSCVAVLGLGAMGGRMAARLIGAGHSVRVWNRSPEKARPLMDQGAHQVATPRDGATGADIVLSMVRDDQAARHVWLDPNTGALGGMRGDAVAIDSSTVTPGWAQALHAACAEAGIACLDAPVSGSRPQAAAGQLFFMVGGEAAVLDRVRDVLAAMGSAVHHAGPAGSGVRIKLIVNALLGIQVAAMGELIGMARRTGLDPARAVEILTASPVASPAAKAAAANMLAGDFSPLFPVELIEKDIGYAIDEAGGGEFLPMLNAARAVMRRAMQAGMTHENMTSVVRLYG